MMILDEIAAYARKRVDKAKKERPLAQLREMAEVQPKGEFGFEKTLQRPEISFICEVKKASPSKGVISEAFPYRGIAKEYEDGGADCISCLTEPKWFLGSDDIFRDIRKQTAIPMIRKDFTVDAYQIYEAKCMGADAILLICSLLDTKTLAQFIELSSELGLSALVETHTQQEIESAKEAGARMIGVNNRNLKDFSVDFSHAARLRDQISEDTLFVAESGLRTPQDIVAMRDIGADAVLIGEALMRAADIKAFLSEMRRYANA